MNAPSPASSNPASPSDQSGIRARISALLTPPRQLSLTRAGKFFLLLTLGIGFGAINTGNNLLFLLFGTLLSLIIASGVLSEAVLRNLEVRRRLPRSLEAGQPAPGKFRLSNTGWWPALSVEASEQNPRCTRGPEAGRILGPERIPWWKFWRRQTGEDRRPMAAAYTLRIDAETEASVAAHYRFPSRGKFELPGLQLVTRFPFSLFEKSRRLPAPAEVTVFPDAAVADEWLGEIAARWGDAANNRRGRGEEFFGLRQYRPGEDQRAIHWKSTARRGEPVVRETESRQRRALLVIFDNRADTDQPGAQRREQFEEGIRHLAGLVRLLGRQGYRVEMVSCDGSVTPEVPGSIEPLLRHLATIELRPRDAPGPECPQQQEHRTQIRVGFDAVLGAASDDHVRLSFDGLSQGAP